MVPTDDLYADLFPALEDVEDDPISDTFEEVGYEAKLSINNLGSLFLFLLFQPIQVLFYKILRRMCKFKPTHRIQKYAESKLNSLLWNGLISFYSSTYLITTMIAFLNMFDLRLDSKEHSAIEIFSSLLSLGFVVGSVVIPCTVMISLYIKIKAVHGLKFTDTE